MTIQTEQLVENEDNGSTITVQVTEPLAKEVQIILEEIRINFVYHPEFLQCDSKIDAAFEIDQAELTPESKNRLVQELTKFTEANLYIPLRGSPGIRLRIETDIKNQLCGEHSHVNLQPWLEESILRPA